MKNRVNLVISGPLSDLCHPRTPRLWLRMTCHGRPVPRQEASGDGPPTGGVPTFQPRHTGPRAAGGTREQAWGLGPSCRRSASAEMGPTETMMFSVQAHGFRQWGRLAVSGRKGRAGTPGPSGARQGGELPPTGVDRKDSESLPAGPTTTTVSSAYSGAG